MLDFLSKNVFFIGTKLSLIQFCVDNSYYILKLVCLFFFGFFTRTIYRHIVLFVVIWAVH